MTDRIFSNHDDGSGRKSSGEAFGLIAWLENTRVVLPLKGVDCRFSVCGGVASVQIDQIYHQENPKPLNCLYSFPLPAGAAVYKCEMHVNNRVIAAKVEEEQKARQIAQEKAAQGHRTALVEVERDNLFTLSLGNVQPQDLIIVRLAFFQALDLLGEERSVRIPFSPGVRYIPGRSLVRDNRGLGTVDDSDQVPDASRITPPRIDGLHPDAAGVFVEGTISNGSKVETEISSPTHVLRVTRGDESSNVALADARDFPDRDLVIRWTEKAPAEERRNAWVTADEKDGADYAFVELRAPDAPEGGPEFEQDVYFLVDRSGSMQGMKWQKAAEAFRAFLTVMGEKDRVFATLFETGFLDVAEKPLPPKQLIADGGVKSLERLGTAGGTELHPALRHVLEMVEMHSAGRPASLVIITDGQVGNEREVLETLRRHPELRVHTFGIDTAVNDAFLKELASQQRGTCCLRTPGDDIAGAVAELGSIIGKPVLRSLKVEGSWEVPSGKLPDLFAGQEVSVLLRWGGEGAASRREPAPLEIGGLLPNGEALSYALEPQRVSQPAIPLLWAKGRITHLIAEGDRAAAIDLARERNILCKGAAFVAWDEAEKTTIANPAERLYQPSMHRQMECMADAGDIFACYEEAPRSRAKRFDRSSATLFEGRTSEPPAFFRVTESDRDGDAESATASPPPPPASPERDRYRKELVVMLREAGIADDGPWEEILDALGAWLEGSKWHSRKRMLNMVRQLFALLKNLERTRGDRRRAIIEARNASQDIVTFLSKAAGFPGETPIETDRLRLESEHRLESVQVSSDALQSLYEELEKRLKPFPDEVSDKINIMFNRSIAVALK